MIRREGYSKANKLIAPRGDGLRISLSAIKGVTKGDALRVLRRPYRFQNAPLESFAVPYGKLVNRHQNYKGKEFAQAAGPTLTPITFRTILVEWGSFVIEHDYDVEDHVNKLKRLARSPYPVQLLAVHKWGHEPEIDLPVLIENVTFTEQSGESDARYVDITVIEGDDELVSRRGRSSREFPFTVSLSKDGKYRVVNSQVPGGYSSFGDSSEPLTFALIAQRAYGLPSYARVVAEAQKPSMSKWGMHTPIIQHPRYKKGGKIVVPPANLADKTGRTTSSSYALITE